MCDGWLDLPLIYNFDQFTFLNIERLAFTFEV